MVTPHTPEGQFARKSMSAHIGIQISRMPPSESTIPSDVRISVLCMHWRSTWHRLSQTIVTGRTPGWEIHDWRYMPHFLIALCSLIAFYVGMGWELP